MSNERFRAYAFTLFDADKSIDFSQYNCQFGIAQKEQCPSTGKVHYQGCIYFKNPRSFRAVRALFGRLRDKKPHIEVARSIPKAINYCRKKDTRLEKPIVYGEEPKGPGRHLSLEVKFRKLNCAVPKLDYVSQLIEDNSLYVDHGLIKELTQVHTFLTHCKEDIRTMADKYEHVCLKRDKKKLSHL